MNRTFFEKNCISNANQGREKRKLDKVSEGCTDIRQENSSKDNDMQETNTIFKKDQERENH